MRRFASRVVVGVAVLTLWPIVASAQTSSIAGDGEGRVRRRAAWRDASKPPAPRLIEKTRTVVTDGSGQYKIIEPRPGTYTVTFTLTGFTTVRREGIELTSDFTATISADLKLGAVAETITVTGEIARRRRAEHHDAHRHDAGRHGRDADGT